ncbi:Uncharacterised protein [Starkeya nomas]|uniref:Uncharacterized protein n=1 Tax=Starkeya nomas TaxID=2666134 RepID=A0A5S9P002_9HYPH|nr:hypothetical protein [Starkeya nomas]CAA0096412.1 Uncharacterised protein [Starkeya nomas]
MAHARPFKTAAALGWTTLWLLATGGTGFTQTTGNPAAGSGSDAAVPTPPAGHSTMDPSSQQQGPTEPDPRTGVLQPPPGPPPEGEEREIRMPDCAPPRCGTPKIMGP